MDNLTQGPNAGDRLPSELEEYTDPNTGVRIRQLTNHRGVEDTHMHFKNDGWYENGTKLLLPLRRPSDVNLFSIDLQSGELRQLTDLPGVIGAITGVDDDERELHFAYKHEEKRESGNQFAVYTLNLDDLSVRRTLTPPEEFSSYVMYVGGVTADSSRLVVRFREPFPALDSDKKVRHQSFPHSVVGTVPTDGSDTFEVVHEEEYWINAVDPSPTDPERAMFYHDGPIGDVDHRIWGLDMESNRVWKIGQDERNECLGRGYWLQNGEDVGYVGWRTEEDARKPVHGMCRDDNSDCTQVQLPADAVHSHANSRRRFICEGKPDSIRRILVYEYDESDGEYRGPRELATQSWNKRYDRPSARFSPDGSTVVFSADMKNDDSNVFLADVPESLEELPRY